MASPTWRTWRISLTFSQHGETGARSHRNSAPAAPPQTPYTHPTQFLLSGEDATKYFSGVRDTEAQFLCPWCLTLRI